MTKSGSGRSEGEQIRPDGNKNRDFSRAAEIGRERVQPRGIAFREEFPMPIFHFDIADSVRLEDPVGLDCKNESDAKKTADMIARQIAIDLHDEREPRSVVVVNEAGLEIYKAPVED
jgi:hypothetical protein